MTFSELGISKELEKALSCENISAPTAIQQKSIPAILEKKDCYLCSETGTGKTLAYLLPILSKIDADSIDLQLLVLLPTHELASQTHQQIQKLAANSGISYRSQMIIGSTSIQRQKENLKRKPHIIVGSTGRILDLIKMKKLKTHKVQTIVIDEIDRLLHGESLESIKKVVKSTLKDRQMVFVSATEQKQSSKEAHHLSKNLEKIETQANQVNSDIEHHYFIEEERRKPNILRKLIHAYKPEKAIVFVHFKETAEVIAAKLAHHKIKVADIHRDCNKLERQKAINDFKQGKAQILVSSDLAARGLDIKGVTHIFNLDIPSKSKDYLHRAGRTGRAGEKGCSVSIMTQEEVSLVKKFQRELKINILPASTRDGKIVVGSEN